jgi:hypothetical protein
VSDSGLAAAPPPAASRPAGEREPVAGAPGWRVTRRVAPAADEEWRAPQRPRPVVADLSHSEAEMPPGALGVPACPPRRVGPPERRRRGISLLALAAAAAVVVIVLGLAAFDMRMPEWPQASPERPAMNAKSGQSAGDAPRERPG